MTVELGNSNGELRTIIDYLQRRARRYLDADEFKPDVKLFGFQQRPRSRIYWFELVAGDQRRLLRIKIPLSNRPQRKHTGPGRPRRFPPAALESKFELEYSALSAIHDYFLDLDDPRFGAVRILDSLPDIRANVMEEINEPNLRQLFAAQNRLNPLGPQAECDVAFRNAGAWLHAYHALDKEADHHHYTRTEFIESFKTVTGFLESKVALGSFFRDLTSMTTAVALAELPETLPIGLAHGDYAMRNILVGPGGRVTVLDTLARWRTAIFEDIGYFLANLKSTWPQIVSQGWAFKSSLITRYEQQFLNGYFENSHIPIRSIRLYEIHALLDRWSARVAQPANRTRINVEGFKVMSRFLENRYFKQSIDQMVGFIA